MVKNTWGRALARFCHCAWLWRKTCPHWCPSPTSKQWDGLKKQSNSYLGFFSQIYFCWKNTQFPYARVSVGKIRYGRLFVKTVYNMHSIRDLPKMCHFGCCVFRTTYSKTQTQYWMRTGCPAYGLANFARPKLADFVDDLVPWFCVFILGYLFVHCYH